MPKIYMRYQALIIVALLAITQCAKAQPFWNPSHSIGISIGVYSYAYNQTPGTIVELSQPAIPNTGVTYQWLSSQSPVSGFTTISGATASSYSPPALTTSSVTMYYERNSTVAGLGTITSNVVKIAVVSVNWEDINYIREHDVITIGQTSWTAIDQLPIGSKLQTTTYLDGLGRSVEKVSRQTATPPSGSNVWGDVVQFSKYDALGREPLKYLPYTTATQSGKFKTTQLTEQPAYYSNASTYNETSAYSQVTFDNSPLNRITNVKESGTSWAASSGNSANYDMNTAAENVQMWSADYVQGDAPVNLGAYPANTLFKLTFNDENNIKSIEYLNMSGQLILKKIQIDNNPSAAHNGWICTYSIYDDFGLLRFQIQPEGVKYLDANSWSFTGTNGPVVLAEQVYQYNYDDKGRIIWKKLPGASPLKMIYDGRDRMVFTQDGNQFALSTPQWTAILYDVLDRPAITTLYNTSETVSALQADIAASVFTTSVTSTAPATPIMNLEVSSRNTSISSYAAQNSIIFSPGFSSSTGDSFTAQISSTATNPASTITTTLFNSPINQTNLGNSSITTIVKYNFYDNYSFNNARALSTLFTNLNAYSNSDPNVIPISPSYRTYNMPTGTMTRILNTSIFLNTTNYFDEKGRQIQALEDNIKTGTDVTTLQYHFSGRLLSSCNNHSSTGTGFTGFVTLTKYNYDVLGRLIANQQQYASNPLKTLAIYDYDDLGRIKTKHLDPNYNNQNSGLPDLESLNYSFNLHNQIIGINKDFATKNPATYNKWGHFFGMYLGFDNKDAVFSKPQLDGQVTGIEWNTQGDDAQRKYDYTYDNAGRLLIAAFNEQQHPGDGWSNGKMDFSVMGTSGQITYDYNGNLLTMLQKGVMPGTAAPLTVDDLHYQYNTFSNKLLSVTDQMTTTTLNGQFGDFKDGTNLAGSPDYVYDNNGNVVVDLNKNSQSLNNGAAGTNGIHYNFLDKPDQIRIVGKGTIEIVYSADGEKLQRAFIPESGGSGTVTTYINQFIFQEAAPITISTPAPFSGTNVSLSYINFEEGRIRIIKASSTGNGYDALTEAGNITLPVSPTGGGGTGVFDYFITDYQKNVRMVLTEEFHSAVNTCTMETSRAPSEDPIFEAAPGAEVETTRFATPPGWTNNTTGSVSQVGKLCGHYIGPNTLQKVMAGDMVSASVTYFYQSGSTGSNPNMVTPLLSSLAMAISGGVTAGTLSHGQATGIASNLNNNPAFVTAIEPNSNTIGTPQAYLTILFFDERFNFVSAADGGAAQQQVASSWSISTPALSLTNIKAPKNGFVYIYVSNRSDQDVYFDNLIVGVVAGNIIEENHYYSFGLKIASISSKKLADINEGQLSNPYQYNDKEMLDEDAGLNWYDYGFRNYDPQIGKFPQLDPLTDDYTVLTPYQFASNDPIANIDIDGLESGEVTGSFSWSPSASSTANSAMNYGRSWASIMKISGATKITASAEKASMVGNLVETITSLSIHVAMMSGDILNKGNTTYQVGSTVKPRQKTTTDAGHGASGDVGAVDGDDYEKDYALAIEKATNDWLILFGIDNDRTRTGDVKKKDRFTWRYKSANNRGSEVFVSFHLNGGTKDKTVYTVYQQDQSNEKESIILANSIAKSISSVMTVKPSSVVSAVARTRFKHILVLHKFTGKAGVLVEFGSVQNLSNRDFINKNATLIGYLVALGIYEYLNGGALPTLILKK